MPQAIELERVWKYLWRLPRASRLHARYSRRFLLRFARTQRGGEDDAVAHPRGSVVLPARRGAHFRPSPAYPRARRQIGFLGHGIGVYEDLSARENLHFFARIADVENARKAADLWLERVGLARAASIPVRQFSRGMRQRLALARTFLHTPKLFLLDEPFTSLDDRAIGMLSELLLDARRRGATIVLSTHQIREALAVASHVALIENGKLRYAGERTPEMLDDPTLLYRLHTELGAA